MSDTDNCDASAPEVKSKSITLSTYGTSDDSSPFPPVNRRVSLLVVNFSVFSFFLAFAYIGSIAIYWAINREVFQWIIVVDITAAACLLLTTLVGISSVSTYLIPILRLVAASVVRITKKKNNFFNTKLPHLQ